jgi:HD-like signal output (HDOD) protein/ActR/RegA family two-component response regulator
MTEQQLHTLIQETEDFPVLSDAATEIVRLTNELSAPVKEVAALLESDLLLLNKMMIVVNSPFYRFSDPITKIEQEISLLGYTKISNMAVSLSLMDQFPPEQSGEYNLAHHWEEAIRTAVAAGEVAARLKENLVEDPFTLGMLLNVGNLFFASELPISFGRALGYSQARNVPSACAERDAIGVDHGKAGALLCERWNLSSSIAELISRHHFFELEEAVAKDLLRTLEVINLASLISDMLSHEEPEDFREGVYERAKEFFNFSPGWVDEILSKIPEQVQKIGSAFSIPLQNQTADREDPSLFLEFCPKCDGPGGSKFCQDCGATLEITTQKPQLDVTKILIAEDSAATRLALSILIRRLGFTALEAINGADALRLARKEKPGMILMDVQMPGMGGLEALSKIRAGQETAHIPVVMLTSITSADTVVEALQAGANDYVVKPFTASVIQDRVSKHMHVDV